MFLCFQVSIIIKTFIMLIDRTDSYMDFEIIIRRMRKNIFERYYDIVHSYTHIYYSRLRMYFEYCTNLRYGNYVRVDIETCYMMQRTRNSYTYLLLHHNNCFVLLVACKSHLRMSISMHLQGLWRYKYISIIFGMIFSTTYMGLLLVF